MHDFSHAREINEKNTANLVAEMEANGWSGWKKHQLQEAKFTSKKVGDLRSNVFDAFERLTSHRIDHLYSWDRVTSRSDPEWWRPQAWASDVYEEIIEWTSITGFRVAGHLKPGDAIPGSARYLKREMLEGDIALDALMRDWQ